MINKIEEIKSLAVFKNFVWSSTVKEKDGSPKEFRDINILYGRNYSGKTTISRIIRALETGVMSDKYVNPDFKVLIKDQAAITQNNLLSHSKNIRVFNEDFIRENLRFIIDPAASIKSFAILGEGNNDLQKEIEGLEAELGNNEEGSESGLYKKLKEAGAAHNAAKNSWSQGKKKLEDQLKKKATGGNASIKYNSAKFGNQNYSIRELNKDIENVSKKDFKVIDNDEKQKLENLLNESLLEDIQTIPKPTLNFSEFVKKVKELVERKVSESGKIEELVKDAILNKWVKEGKEIHQDKEKNCGFCGNPISTPRWEQIEKHFDEESEKLENEMNDLLKSIETEKSDVKKSFNPDINLFYTTFHADVVKVKTKFSELSGKYIEELDSLRNQIEARLGDILNPKTSKNTNNYSEELLSVWNDFEIVREKSNKFSEELGKEKKKAQELLRFREVFDFLTTIKYTEQLEEIGKLEKSEQVAQSTKSKIALEIKEKVEQIQSKNRLLNDEEKGALKVNQFLNDFFGHGSLELQAIEEERDDGKQVKFQVIRDGREAHHLSEGECSLLAFCYFMAKLEDVNTKGSKPIIWIDDPISSLDGNHIFFIYSLIQTEIVEKANFEQLFVSTHNLDFLKYLKRLTGGIKPENEKFKEFQKAFFLVNRKDKVSEILAMPKYLKEYITEFNFLFEQIYKCSQIEQIDDSNYTVFYNFGNNARKFLEIYLYYKYPDWSSETDKMKKFFGSDSVPTILTQRVNNEYSHLSGTFERGSTPVEVPEMKKTADLIISKLKEDADQYSSLLNSIGVEQTVATA